MKKIIALSTAALLSTALVAAPALAQVSVDVGGNGGVSVGGGSGSAGAGVGGSAGVDAGSGGVSAGGNAGAGATVGTDGGSGVKLGADAAGSATLDTDSTTAAIGADLEGAMSAMARGSDAAASVGTMTKVSSVNVVKVDGSANADAWAKAEADNKAGIDELRASLAANAEVKAALDAQSVDSTDVVAADVNADGSLTVYVR